MSGRIYSRPRTRVYDANYNIGESYYKSALDRLDRKYSGRPTTPPPRQVSVPKDILERHERAFADEDLSTARSRASKHISESHLLDGIGSSRAADRALEVIEGDLDEEVAAKLRRIRASKKQSVIDDLDLENMVSNISTRRMKERSDKLLDSVGLSSDSARSGGEDYVYKRRSMKVSYAEDVSDKGSEGICKWTPLSSGKELSSLSSSIKESREEDSSSASSAALRARMSRARLEELEDESNAIVERQQARDRRAAKLRSILAECSEEAN